jgi:hypothetical protein
MTPSTDEEWEAAVSSSDWGTRVAEALRNYFSSGGPLMEPVRLVEVNLDTDSDGTPVLLAIYLHPFWPERTGLRLRLDRDRRPLGDTYDTPEESLAADIAYMRISEPLGRQYDLLVEDADGVWWWGDGYPELGEHPDFNLEAGETRRVSCLLRGSFDPYPRDLERGTLILSGDGASWVSIQNTDSQPLTLDVPVEAVSSLPMGFQEPSTYEVPAVDIVLMPSPITVTCDTSFGQIELVVTPADAAIVHWFFTRMVT